MSNNGSKGNGNVYRNRNTFFSEKCVNYLAVVALEMVPCNLTILNAVSTLIICWPILGKIPWYIHFCEHRYCTTCLRFSCVVQQLVCLLTGVDRENEIKIEI